MNTTLSKSVLRLLIIAAFLAANTLSLQAVVVRWTDWSTGNPTPGVGTAAGTITVGTNIVSVSYTNLQGYGFIQTGNPGDTDYWQNSNGTNGSPYTSSQVDNIPTAREMIGLRYAGNQTLVFSETVSNL